MNGASPCGPTAPGGCGAARRGVQYRGRAAPQRLRRPRSRELRWPTTVHMGWPSPGVERPFVKARRTRTGCSSSSMRLPPAAKVVRPSGSIRRKGLPRSTGSTRTSACRPGSTGGLLADGLRQTGIPQPAILEGFNVERRTAAALSAARRPGHPHRQPAGRRGHGAGRRGRSVGAGPRREHLASSRPHYLSIDLGLTCKEHLMNPDASSTTGGRCDEEGDWIVRQFIAPADLQRPPEEYVARHAHSLGAFSFHLYRFRDPGLGAWVRRVGELFASEEEVERCRERFLSPDDLANARAGGRGPVRRVACDASGYRTGRSSRRRDERAAHPIRFDAQPISPDRMRQRLAAEAGHAGSRPRARPCGGGSRPWRCRGAG